MRNVIAGLLFLMVFPLAGVAQDLPTPSQKPDSDWYQAFDFNFKLGQDDEAEQIWREHFQPAGQALRLEVFMFVHESGKWDMTVYVPMDGPGDLAWDPTPFAAEWWAALAQQEGGAEEARAVFDSWYSKIADANSTIVRRPH
jgi:hypothetical protein